MKKTILFLPFILLSCKKEYQKPDGDPIKPVIAYAYRVEGMTSTDTATVLFNGKPIESVWNHYLTVNSGDSLNIYYAGNYKKTGFNFAYWPIDNRGASADNVVSIKSKQRIWISHFIYTNSSKDPKPGSGDSVAVLTWRYYIKETIVF